MLSVWSGLWVEWLLLQTAIISALFRVYTTLNYLRQVLALMWFVALLCLYLSLWQLELFACFLFLGEFTILIFFYCLLLHLKASIAQQTTSGNTIETHYPSFSCIISFTLWLVNYTTVNTRTENQITCAVDLYRIASDFILNDLTSLYFYFTVGNTSIHLLIGFILFVLTLFLFTAVTFYTTSNLTKKLTLRSTSSKLFTSRGYYEQNANTSQKYFFIK